MKFPVIFGTENFFDKSLRENKKNIAGLKSRRLLVIVLSIVKDIKYSILVNESASRPPCIRKDTAQNFRLLAQAEMLKYLPATANL